MRELVLSTRSPISTAARSSVLALLLKHIALWLEVRRQRRQLASLSDAMLHDIGISRADAEGEYSRPFWDLPESCR